MTIDQNLILTPPNEAGRGIVDTRISEMYQVLPPIAVIEKFPTTEFTTQIVFRKLDATFIILNRV